MKKKIYYLVFLSLLVGSYLMLSNPCLAQGNENLEVPNPLGNREVPVIVGDLIKYILGFVGVIALVMFIYGGIMWMTSAGNQEKIKTGKETIVWAIIGMAFIFFSYAIVEFVLKAFIKK